MAMFFASAHSMQDLRDKIVINTNVMESTSGVSSQLFLAYTVLVSISDFSESERDVFVV